MTLDAVDDANRSPSTYRALISLILSTAHQLLQTKHRAVLHLLVHLIYTMRSFFFSFIALAFLFTTFALPTATLPERELSSPEAEPSLHLPSSREVTQSRQNSRARIVRRRKIRNVLEAVKRTRCTPVHYPTPSARQYPTCENSLGTGYAKYPGW